MSVEQGTSSNPEENSKADLGGSAEQTPQTEIGQALPIIDLTEEDLKALDAPGEWTHTTVDYLRYKDIQPDTGPVQIRFPGGRTIALDTDSTHYGGVYDPREYEGPINPRNGEAAPEYDPDAPVIDDFSIRESDEFFERYGHRPTLADVLRVRGIEPDSGLVRLKQDKHWIYVNAASDHFGELYTPE